MQTTKLRKVIITGSNKGIGYSLVELLLRSSTPYDIILTSRNPKLGQVSLAKLAQSYPDSPSKLNYTQLDVTDSKSISAFKSWIETEKGGFDVLVNNAGIGYGVSKTEEKLATIDTNIRGPIKLTETLLPLMSSDGKIIMISS
jgi:carbonyl reductase 1